MFRFLRKNKGSKPAGRVGLQQQLDVLGEHGIVLNPGREIDELTAMYSRDELEKKAYMVLLECLGCEVEEGLDAGQPFCDQVYTQDTECIEDSGDYERVVRNLVRLFGGGLVIESLEDEFDWERAHAAVQFVANGQKYRMVMEFQDDWLDPAVIDLVLAAAEDACVGQTLLYLNTGGQSMVLISLPRNRVDQFRSITGLDLKLLRADRSRLG